MRKNKLIILNLSILIMFIIMLVGTSYAYFTHAIKGGDNTRVIIKTANMLLRYDEGDELVGTDVIPGWEGHMDFSIENYSVDTSSKYKITLEVFSHLSDSTINEFVYTLDSINPSYNSDNVLVLKEETQVPVETTEIGIGKITPNTIHNYRLTLKLKDNGLNQNYLMGKQFVAKVKVELINE